MQLIQLTIDMAMEHGASDTSTDTDTDMAWQRCMRPVSNYVDALKVLSEQYAAMPPAQPRLNLAPLFDASGGLAAILGRNAQFASKLFQFDDESPVSVSWLLLTHIRDYAAQLPQQTRMPPAMLNVLLAMVQSAASPSANMDAVLSNVARIAQYLAQISRAWRSQLLERGLVGHLREQVEQSTANLTAQTREFCLQVVSELLRRAS